MVEKICKKCAFSITCWTLILNVLIVVFQLFTVIIEGFFESARVKIYLCIFKCAEKVAIAVRSFRGVEVHGRRDPDVVVKLFDDHQWLWNVSKHARDKSCNKWFLRRPVFFDEHVGHFELGDIVSGAVHSVPNPTPAS